MSKGKVIGAIVALLVVGGAAAAFALGGSSAAEVSAEAAELGDLAVTVSASGQVQADAKVDLYPPTAGTLASIEVTEGQQVTAGTVIAIMDTAPTEVQLAQAEAAYAGAVAQRDAVAKSTPGKADKNAAQAAVNAAWSAYEIANAQYEAAKAGAGAPTASDIAQAEAAVALAQASFDAAQAAYNSYYTNVYLPAPEPRDPALETALAALTLARDQAAESLVTAQKTLAALLAAQNSDIAIESAKAAKDQAYAAYLGAVAQKDALAKASSVTSAMNSADAAIDAAEAARALAEDTLAKTEITAPRDGVVLFNGAAAASLLTGSSGGAGKPTEGSAVSPASAPFSIVDFGTLMFSAQVDEADIASIEPGMPAVIELDGITDTTFETSVERIDKVSVLTSTGGTAFAVFFRLDSADDLLLGMNGSVEIEVDTIASAVTIPVEALLEEGTTEYVYRVVDGKAVYTEVDAGRLTDTRAEIVSGLDEGDLVITSGVAELEDGAPVQVK